MTVRPSPDEDSTATSVLEQGLGLFGSPEDAALLDEVVSIAYQERRRANKREPTLRHVGQRDPGY